MKKTIISIGTAIYKLLSEDTDILKLIKNKSAIYPLVSPLDTKFPFLVYSRNSNDYNSNKDYRMDNASISISCVSDRYEEAVELAELVREKLKVINTEINGIFINKIKLDNTNEYYANDAYVQELTFNCIVTI
ncbi:DUF3168 domain-containing protein [Parabacteroides sp. OttesenSCG-928-J18]|nr:DUF3168 domain-containing protein [Parabacteroides sp. OttesenSCG-928-J18]